MLKLYPHQLAATEATFDFFAEHAEGHPLIVAPVASGKSLLIAEFIRRACALYADTNFLVLSHVTELLVQNADHLRLQWPEASISFCAAKLGRKSFAGQAIFASINSIYKLAYKIPKRIDIILIDECHLVSPTEGTMYQAFIKDMLAINPHLRVIGYTGTPFRATEGRLTEGEGRLFTHIAYQIPMLYLIEKGFLCPLVTPAVKTRMSVVGVGTQGGDYIQSQLAAAVDKDYITRACVDETVAIAKEQGRKKWLVFTADIAHCTHVMEEIRSRGISCEMLTGKTPTKERNEIYRRYKAGEFTCLVNVAVATTGVNIPDIDLLVFMRPSKSPVLVVQMAGRGMRVFPGKTDCCLLDFGRVIAELGPIDLIDAKRVVGGSGDGEAPIKVCPTCHAVCFAGVKHCQDCGYEFPVQETLQKTASTAAAMSNQVEPEWHNVLSTAYRLHAKEGKTPSMCVVYNTLAGPFREWICYEHTGFAREKAARWHRKMSADMLPAKITDALRLTYRKPKRILVRQVGKFFEIISHDFGE